MKDRTMLREQVAAVEGLTVADASGMRVLDGVALSVRAGEIRAVVGESGSGKTTLALALLGRVRMGLAVSSGRIEVAGRSVLELRGAALQQYRRDGVSWLSQDPALSLTPHLRVEELLREVAGPDGRDAAEGLLASVGLDGVRGILRRRPAELSGGQRRRVAIARAVAAHPRLLVLDEPTAGLDAAAAKDVARMVVGLRERSGLAVLTITHDLSFAYGLADSVSIMERGRIVEEGSCQQVLRSPASDYARQLVGARALDPTKSPPTGDKPPVLRVMDLTVTTPDGKPAATGASFELRPGEGLAVLGPSGAGKSTLVAALVGSRPADSGTIELRSGDSLEELPPERAGRKTESLLSLQVIPQDPATSLNPAVSAGRQVDRAVARRHPAWSRSRRRERALELMEMVGLDGSALALRPRALSGGQAQRMAIVRALAHEPRVLVCDESTSALDATTQKEVLEVLARLRDQEGLAIVAVTHSERVARFLCTKFFRIGVQGRPGGAS